MNWVDRLRTSADKRMWSGRRAVVMRTGRRAELLGVTGRRAELLGVTVRHENVKDWRREMVLTFRVVRCDTGNDNHLRDEESTMRISYFVLC